MSNKTFSERVQSHPIYVIIVIGVAIVIASWAVFKQVLYVPCQEENRRLDRELEKGKKTISIQIIELGSFRKKLLQKDNEIRIREQENLRLKKLYAQTIPPKDQIISDFWSPFLDSGQFTIILGAPIYSWSGPIFQKERDKDYNHLIEIHEGNLCFNLLTDSPEFRKLGSNLASNGAHYLFPTSNTCNFSDSKSGIRLRNFLTESEADVILSNSTNGLLNKGNVILIGGPNANPATKHTIDKLHNDYRMNFDFKFSLYKHPQSVDSPIVDEAIPGSDFGITDSAKSNEFIVKFNREEPNQPGRDGAIIIKSINPDDPNSTIVIIAGIDEYGTAAAVELLSTTSAELREINNLYSRLVEPGAIEFIIETKFHKGKYSAPKIINKRLIHGKNI